MARLRWREKIDDDGHQAWSTRAYQPNCGFKITYYEETRQYVLIVGRSRPWWLPRRVWWPRWRHLGTFSVLEQAQDKAQKHHDWWAMILGHRR
jgi:hypothetical protein